MWHLSILTCTLNIIKFDVTIYKGKKKQLQLLHKYSSTSYNIYSIYSRKVIIIIYNNITIIGLIIFFYTHMCVCVCVCANMKDLPMSHYKHITRRRRHDGRWSINQLVSFFHILKGLIHTNKRFRIPEQASCWYH